MQFGEYNKCCLNNEEQTNPLSMDQDRIRFLDFSFFPVLGNCDKEMLFDEPDSHSLSNAIETTPLHCDPAGHSIVLDEETSSTKIYNGFGDISSSCIPFASPTKSLHVPSLLSAVLPLRTLSSSPPQPPPLHSTIKPHHKENWKARFQEFIGFVDENGHGTVPHNYPKNPQLARWVKRQRHQYKLKQEGKQSTMTDDRVDLLNSVGFVWDSHEVNWREKVAALKRFHNKHGHCNVPVVHKQDKLGMWVKCQRRQYKLYCDGKPSSMNPQRIFELEKLGFEWEVRNQAFHSENRQ